jgi:hypothetical protein
MLDGFSNILKTLNPSEVYSNKPPHGPSDEYPVLADSELKKLQESMTGISLGNHSAYTYMKMVDKDLSPKTVRLPSPHHLFGKSIWSIDGSSKTLDYTAFHLMLARSALVEYQYTQEPKPIQHEISTYDCGAVCVVDGNVFSDKLHLFSKSTKGRKDRQDFSWIPVLNTSTEPIIVSYDSNALDKKPSMHAMGWCNKFMQTLELLAHYKIPKDREGIVIRDGPIFPIYASNVDIQKSLEFSLKWKNKLLICSSKRISESTLFLEYLLNPSSEGALNFYFENQGVTKSVLGKLPADYLLLQKILKPGQRTPFLEVFPHNQKSILKNNPDLIPISTYYMRRRSPHTIIRLEFPKKYLSNELKSELDFAISCVAWQHELGTKVPHVQEFADRQCQLKPEAAILRKVTASRLAQEGLETLEVYE